MQWEALLWLWVAACGADVAEGGLDQSRTKGGAGLLGFVSTTPGRWSAVKLSTRSRHSARWSSGSGIVMKDPRVSSRL